MSLKRYFTLFNLFWFTIELLVIWVLLSPMIAKPWYMSILFANWMNSGLTEIPAIAGTRKTVETVSTPTGVALNAWYFKKPGAKYIVLVNHGNAGTIVDRRYLIEELLNDGVSVFIYDYAGYGKSTGKPSVEEICADGDAAYDYLIQQLHVRPSDVVLLGESVGTGVACRIASHREYRSLILQSPFKSMLSLGKRRLFWLNFYPSEWVTATVPDLNNQQIIPSLTKPILIIYGQQDATVPTSDPIELSKLNRTCTLIGISGRGHNDLYYPAAAAYQSALRDFLAK